MKSGNFLAHIDEKSCKEDLQVQAGLVLLFLLLCISPSLCLFFLCAGFIAYLSQQVQKSPEIIIDLSGLGSTPDPVTETRRFSTLLGPVLCPLHSCRWWVWSVSLERLALTVREDGFLKGKLVPIEGCYTGKGEIVTCSTLTHLFSGIKSLVFQMTGFRALFSE